MKRAELTITVLFGIALVATLLFFFLYSPPADRTDVDYTAFLFLLLSEVALYVAARLILPKKHDGPRLFLVAGVLVTLAIYLVINTVLTVIVAPLYGGELRHFFLLESLFLCVASALTVVFVAFAARAS